MPTTREIWIQHLVTMVQPVLHHFAAGDIQQMMPVETAANRAEERKKVSYLEAIARSLAGIAPWFECPVENATEMELREQCFSQAATGLNHAFANNHDFLRNDTHQDLVEAAFLSQALLRSPRLLAALSDKAREGLVRSLQLRRPIHPPYNNWLLFAAEVESLLKTMGADWDIVRIDYALREHEGWYKGDGSYGDGPDYHHDYYNSYVIQPMLLDVLDAVGDPQNRWGGLAEKMQERARRFAAIQERMIHSDGSFPVMGRSIAYRSGAFQALAQAALRQDLPDNVSPAQVRCALSAVLHKTLTPSGTYDEQGWLRIGLSGHQPSLGEDYISTGSLYLASQIFLPLGLPANAAFWSNADEPWTAVKAWSGVDLAKDHALKQ